MKSGRAWGLKRMGGDTVRSWILSLVLLAGTAPAVLADGRWETAARLDAPRAGLAVVVQDGRLYAAGGSGLTDPRAEFESYDIALDRWMPETPLPRGLEQFGMAAIGDRIYAAGGYASGEEGGVAPSAAMWSWSQQGNIWQREAAMPAAKADFALLAVEDRLYAVGGLDGDRSMFVFDPVERVWDSVDVPDGVSRRAAAAIAVEGRIYVVGGLLEGAATDRVDIYDPQADEWSLGAALPGARSGPAVAAHSGRIHLLGGRDTRHATLQSHISWRPGDAQWRDEADLPSPRTGADAAVLNDGIYLVGGGTGGGFFAPFTALDTTDVFVDEAS